MYNVSIGPLIPAQPSSTLSRKKSISNRGILGSNKSNKTDHTPLMGVRRTSSMSGEKGNGPGFLPPSGSTSHDTGNR
jgi:hypothetical protein